MRVLIVETNQSRRNTYATNILTREPDKGIEILYEEDHARALRLLHENRTITRVCIGSVITDRPSAIENLQQLVRRN